MASFASYFIRIIVEWYIEVFGLRLQRFFIDKLDDVSVVSEKLPNFVISIALLNHRQLKVYGKQRSF